MVHSWSRDDIHTHSEYPGWFPNTLVIIEAGKTSYVKPLLSNAVLVSPCYNHMLKVG